MASGHVNRIKRPNTWLHRPLLQNVKKALANPEPSTHGTKPTCCRSRLMSDVGGGTDLARARFKVFYAIAAPLGTELGPVSAGIECRFLISSGAY